MRARWIRLMMPATFSVFESDKSIALHFLLGAQNLRDRFLFEALAAGAAVVVVVERDLRVAPRIEMADLMDALDRAGRRL